MNPKLTNEKSGMRRNLACIITAVIITSVINISMCFIYMKGKYKKYHGDLINIVVQTELAKGRLLKQLPDGTDARGIIKYIQESGQTVEFVELHIRDDGLLVDDMGEEVKLFICNGKIMIAIQE